MLDDFFIRSLLAALGVALAAAPLGCFVAWRRMAFFGDATAHAAILGVAISLGFEISIFAGVLAISAAMALAVWAIAGRETASDTVLAVMSHSALAFGLVAVSMLPSVRVDLTAYLFGDILSVSKTDLGVICIGALVVCGLVAMRWSSMLTATLNPEIALASGIRPRMESLILTFLLALVVAVAIKVVGALLIGALMIIPAAAARPLTRTPEAMVGIALVFGGISAAGGLFAAFEFDTPAGPTIVCAAALIFAATTIWSALIRSR